MSLMATEAPTQPEVPRGRRALSSLIRAVLFFGPQVTLGLGLIDEGRRAIAQRAIHPQTSNVSNGT